MCVNNAYSIVHLSKLWISVNMAVQMYLLGTLNTFQKCKIDLYVPLLIQIICTINRTYLSQMGKK